MSASMKTFEEMIEERANFLWDRDLGPKGNKEHYDKKAHDELILEYAAKNPEMIKPPADGAKECAMQIFDECISAGNTFRIDEAAKLIDIYCRTQPAAAAVQDGQHLSEPKRPDLAAIKMILEKVATQIEKDCDERECGNVKECGADD